MLCSPAVPPALLSLATSHPHQTCADSPGTASSAVGLTGVRNSAPSDPVSPSGRHILAHETAVHFDASSWPGLLTEWAQIEVPTTPFPVPVNLLKRITGLRATLRALAC